MNKLLYNILNWSSFILNGAGATLVALNIGMEWWGYVLVLLGSAVLGVISYKIRNTPLFLSAIVWCIVDTIGVVRWM